MTMAVILAKSNSRQTVDLINDNHVHLGVGDIGEKPLQGRAVQCPSRRRYTRVGKTDHPSCFWERMKAAQASRWASSELNACSRPSSEDLRV